MSNLLARWWLEPPPCHESLRATGFNTMLTQSPHLAVPHGQATLSSDMLWLSDDRDLGGNAWQARWAKERGAVHVAQHDTAFPLRGDWLAQLESAVREQPTCRLVAHGLGCALAVAWAAYSSLAYRVQAALLLAPFSPDPADPSGRYRSWRPLAAGRLPFPALILVDPTGRDTVAQQTAFAAVWGACVLSPQLPVAQREAMQSWWLEQGMLIKG
jgi:predicted alpha/beta hydrolase family esterase